MFKGIVDMFWQKKEKQSPSVSKKPIFEQLYSSDRKMPKDVKLDMSYFSKKEQKEYKRYEFIRPYLNIKLGGLWTIEQKDHIYGSVDTYDQPNRCLVFDIFHGEMRVGELNFELDVDGLFLDSFKGRISTKFHAYWFDASEVKWFLRSLASIHHDHNSKKYEQQKLETNLKISESMTDNLWNAIQRTRDDGYVHEPNPYLEWIEIGFDGNFDSYFLHIKHWKNRKLDPFELEERQINKSNEEPPNQMY